ncbi:MAG TPA: TfoX/Sxy family protein [Jatrophihabitans sp.]|jgi:hypothetical protein|nr:TfoX/Sxy family protein [Jatrophihabitans sp.]
MAYDADLAERLRALLAGRPGVSEKGMFGGWAFLLGGHLAVAASRDGGLLLRCDPARTDELVAGLPATRMEMHGRQLDGWLRVPAPAVEDDEQLRRMVALGTEYAGSLRPK